MKLSRKLAALAMAVLLAVSLTACSPKQVAQDMVVHLVHKLGLVEESDEDDTDTTTTVSYTHLRAHETRHDLVCRLLLEKKKTTNETRTRVI